MNKSRTRTSGINIITGTVMLRGPTYNTLNIYLLLACRTTLTFTMKKKRRRLAKSNDKDVGPHQMMPGQFRGSSQE